MNAEEIHHFTMSVRWDAAAKGGRLTQPDGGWELDTAGGKALGGTGAAANPEELLLAALSSCFAQTWAIFIAKLGLDVPVVEIEARCAVENDPAGGYKITAIELKPRVPAGVWSADRAKVEKTLSLAEKYCIVSKSLRGEGRSLRVDPAPG